MPGRPDAPEAWVSPPPRRGGLRVAVAYPNTYRVGMSNLGYQTVLRNFLEDPGFDARRVFMDGATLLFPDGGRSLEEFDAVILSVSYQPDMVHLPRLLEAGRVSAVSPGPRPLIIGGGVALTINPETCFNLFDIVVLGDAEPALPGLKEMLLTGAESRDELLESAAPGPGVYIPGWYTGETVAGSPFLCPRSPWGDPPRIKTALAENLDDRPARPAVVSSGSEFGELYMLEVSRGCGAGCSFCAAGSVCGPVRFLGMDAFAGEADLGLRYRSTVGLVGTAVSYHPDLEKMAGYLLDRGGSFSPSSMRAERITPSIADLLVRAGHQTVSLAPEAGAEGLRGAIGKGIRDEELLEKVDILFDAGVPNLKLYFMVGLPGETESDAESVVDLVSRMRDRMIHWARPRGRVGSLTVSVNPFVPKPRTPFERVPMAPESALRGRMKKIRLGLGPLGGVNVQTGSVRGAYLDGLLSLGDRRVAEALDKLPPGGVSIKRLMKIFPDTERVLFGRESGELPWGFIK